MANRTSLPGTRSGSSPVARSVLLLLASALLVAAAPSSTALDPYELGIAQREAGHLRAIVERLSKQNLLYQLHLGGVSKLDMQESANEIDRLIEILERGSSAYAVAKPPNAQVIDQLEIVSDSWSPLRRISLASPYDYLRYSSDLMPRSARLGDPLMIRGFDRRSQAMIVEADKLMRLYQEACEAAGGKACGLAANSGLFEMLAERISKELVLIYAGLDTKDSIGRLKDSRETFESSLVALGKSPILAAAMNPARGVSAEVVKTSWNGMQEAWERLRFEVDLAIDDRADALDIRRMLELQTGMVQHMERLRASLSRYAVIVQESA